MSNTPVDTPANMVSVAYPGIIAKRIANICYACARTMPVPEYNEVVEGLIQGYLDDARRSGEHHAERQMLGQIRPKIGE